MNRRRGLIQFGKRGDTSPEVHDILVFSDTLYGHLAIVANVSQNSVEVVQQNSAGKPLETFSLTKAKGNFFVHSPRTPDGWLRIKQPDPRAPQFSGAGRFRPRNQCCECSCFSRFATPTPTVSTRSRMLLSFSCP
ncbi:MAG: CHAP domain-containing protein [Methylococcales bacterium]